MDPVPSGTSADVVFAGLGMGAVPCRGVVLLAVLIGVGAVP